jgi:cytosine/uracil/thiamine/allantoin permease
MGLVGATRTPSPKRYLLFIAILQFVMCFLPLAFDKFIEYFEFFLGIVGGIFVPLWTLVVIDYFVVRRRQVRDEDLFAGEGPDGSTRSRLGDWNLPGWISMAMGLGVFYLLHYGLKDAAAVWTASFPAIGVTALSYLVLTLGFKLGRVRLPRESASQP